MATSVNLFQSEMTTLHFSVIESFFAEVHVVLELFLSWHTMHIKRAKAYSD